jgi:adenylate cyclase
MRVPRLAAKLLPTALGLGLTLLFAWSQFSAIPLLKALEQRVESLVYDLRLNATLPERNPDDQRIVIVDIDEQSLAAEGRWPWPRDKIAALTERLFAAGVAVVGYDIFFSEAERNSAAEVVQQLQGDGGNRPLIDALTPLAPQFDHDARLADALRGHDVTLGYLFHDEQTTPVGALPQPLLTLTQEAAHRSGIKAMSNYTATLPQLQEAAASSGFVTTWRDPDGIIRRVPMIIRHGNEVYGSLSLNVAKLYLLIDEIGVKTAPVGDFDAVEKITLGGEGGATIPTDGHGFALVPYSGRAGSFPYLSASDVLKGNFKPEALEGGIVLIGATAVGISDLVATPVENIYPGVEVHATMIRAILDNRFPSQPSWAAGANLITTLALGIVLALLLPQLPPLWLFATGAVIAAGLSAGNLWLWQEKGLALALAWPLLLIVALIALNISHGYLRENRKRSQLKSIFGQYIPPQLVESMGEDMSDFGFEGESREMTVLFADIRGFTTLSEKLSPAELRALLNRYFTHMTGIIFDHHGTIDKYVGDMIMAFWGAPLRDPNHARRAIEAALEMLRKTDELRPQLLAEGYPNIDIGIGLNSGLMNVGDMGSSYRRAYTVLGDNVNLGSRIEGLSKFYGARLVVGEATRAGQEGFIFRHLDLVKVKGKTAGVNVYEPLCLKSEATPELLQELALHEQGLSAYRNQYWELAQQSFATLARQHPAAHLYPLYLERIRELQRRPPNAEWDGVYERREK